MADSMAVFMRFLAFLFIFIFSPNIITAWADDILGCGGFVKSDIEIDFVRVEIKLFTKQGSLKYHTDCAPNNGYYFLPLYDKGEYVLQVSPPEGWEFEPMEVPLKIDGSTDPCSRGQDVNFIFKGFGVTGKVVSLGRDKGPEGLQVFLKENTEEGKVLAKASTGKDGEFSFSQVLPGKYRVQVQQSKWKMSRSKSDINVTRDNGRVQQPLVIQGYDVTGHVTSDNEPVQGVKFILFAPADVTDGVEGCDRSPVAGFSSSFETAPTCHVVSGASGSFVFPVLPPGKYRLVPFYKADHIKFDVSPLDLSFEVGHGSLVLPTKFEVKGFAVSGKVTYCNGCQGVADASVILDGKEVSVTDQNGVYHLENMRTGTYRFHVKSASEDVTFGQVQIKVTPTSPSLPEITAASFRVCGAVIEEQSASDVPRKVMFLFDGAGPDAMTVDTEDEGRFCVFLKPGKYRVTVAVLAEEESTGLRFSPAFHQVEVKTKPVNNIIFSQFKAQVKGKVMCLAPCSSLEVTLHPLDDSILKSVVRTTIGPQGNFAFSDVLPGRYEASVHKDDWCWEEKSLTFSVTSSDVSDLKFQQTGFVVTIASTHETLVKYTQSTGASGNLPTRPGTSKTCLPNPGLYEFTPVGCHTFSNPKVIWDTSKPTVVRFDAVSHLLGGSVVASEAISDLKIRVSSGGKEVTVLSVEEEKPNQYKFQLQARRGEKLELQPMAEKFLFEPNKMQVTGRDECVPLAAQFQGKRGKFISGQITPPLSGVTITITSEAGGLDRPLVLQTDAQGKYQVGPLKGEFEYSVAAEKRGYVLNPTGDGSGSFTAQKLGEVVVVVTDESNQPLQGVLLSLSGGANYRQNSQTKSDGKMVFSSLSPGDYFLRPMMKEYNFQPNSQMLKVQEVESVDVKLIGKRVAFSCMGTITSITGESEAGVMLEAIGQGSCSHYQEEAMSEQEGTFRIRGLMPKCEYVLRLKKEPDTPQHVERLAPAEYNLKIELEDVRGIHLMAFRPFHQMDVTGSVETSLEFLKTLRVKLFQEGVPDSPLHVLKLDQSPFFLLPPVPLDHKFYWIQLESTLSRSTYRYESPEASFRANSTFRHISLKFEPQLRSLDHDIARGSYLTLPLLLVLLALGANHQRVLKAVGEARRALQSVAVARGERGSDAAVMVEPIARRKVRPRKT